MAKELEHIWHPYTQMKEANTLPPILIEKAKGLKLFDASGNYYYDTISSWWCNLHGHCHPKINAAIKKQLDQLEHVIFAGFTHKGAIKLAKELVRIAPKGLNKVFFSDDGSTAVETALKMSFQYWKNKGNKKKNKFLCLEHGYHGDTLGAMSVSGVDRFNQAFSPLLFKVIRTPAPIDLKSALRSLEQIIKQHHNEIAAFILEPILMAAGGMIIYDKEYLVRARQLTKKYNIHLIADEVATGFGRTGKMFACEHAGISPDFMCLSKGLTAGYMPMGATLTTDKIYKAFYADVSKGKTFYHGHTFTANPLACAAALASLDIFREQRTIFKIQKLAQQLKTELERFKDLAIVKEVRSIGMVGVIELNQLIAKKIYRRGLKQNLILRPLGNLIYFFFPFCITEAEIKKILDRTYRLLKILIPSY